MATKTRTTHHLKFEENWIQPYARTGYDRMKRDVLTVTVRGNSIVKITGAKFAPGAYNKYNYRYNNGELVNTNCKLPYLKYNLIAIDGK